MIIMTEGKADAVKESQETAGADMRADTLEKALAIDADRGAVYGGAERNLENIACLWTDYFFHKQDHSRFLPADVAVMMALLKISRISSGTFHQDNFVDGANYLALAADMAARDASEVE